MITKLFTQSLLIKNTYFVSRQKILLKRRKISSKKQKVAKKKFIQQNPDLNFTHQLKILQIQKQLDKKVNKNQHLNQLMDQLFYPDVRYANQKNISQQLLKIQANTLNNKPNKESQNKNQKLKNIQENQQNQDFQQQNQQYDQLLQQIKICQIPSQFFQLYLKNAQYFTHYHLTYLLNRLKYYFKNKPKIQQKITLKWKQSLKKIKLTSEDQKKRKKCPYIFLQKQQLIRDQNWNKIMKHIKQKISLMIQVNQNKEQNKVNNYDQTFLPIQNNCDLALNILSTADYIPQQIFNIITQKVFKFIETNQTQKKDKIKSQNYPQFSHSQKVKILRVLAQKSQTKSTLTQHLQINQPQISKNYQQKIIAFGKKICLDILSSKQCTPQELTAIIKSSKGYYKFVNSHILDNAKPLILKFMNKTSLQRSIQYLYCYFLNGTTKDIQFLQILKFDIYRKLPYSRNKSYLFSLISFIIKGRITFRQSQLSLKVSQIYPRIVETVSEKYLSKGHLNHQQLKRYLNSIYYNYPLNLANNNKSNLLNLVQIISTEVVKIGQGFKIQELSDIFFKITILGHRSKNVSKYLLKRFRQEYKKLIKKYKEQRVELIQDKSIKKAFQQIQQNNQIKIPSINQILLQEKLIMFLWSLMLTYKNINSQLPLNDLLQIYPIKITSQDPMILELIQDLNLQLKQFNFFPKIKSGYSQIVKQQKIQEQNQDQIKAPNKRKRNQKLKQAQLNSQSLLLLKTNSYKKYSYHYQDQYTLKQMIESLQSNNQTEQNNKKLLDICIRSWLVKNKNSNLSYIPNRWTDSAKQIIQKRKQIYEKNRLNIYQIYKKTNSNQKQQKDQILIKIGQLLQKNYIIQNQSIKKQQINLKLQKNNIFNVKKQNKKIYDLF